MKRHIPLLSIYTLAALLPSGTSLDVMSRLSKVPKTVHTGYVSKYSGTAKLKSYRRHHRRKNRKG